MQDRVLQVVEEVIFEILGFGHGGCLFAGSQQILLKKSKKRKKHRQSQVSHSRRSIANGNAFGYGQIAMPWMREQVRLNVHVSC